MSTVKYFIPELPQSDLVRIKCMHNEQTIGLIECRISEIQGTLETLAVEKQYQQQGIGTELVVELQDYIKKLKKLKVPKLVARLDRNMTLYTRLGWKFHSVDNTKKIPVTILEKII